MPELTPAPDPAPTALDNDVIKEIGQNLYPVEPGHVQMGIDAVERIRRLRPIEICGFHPVAERRFFF